MSKARTWATAGLVFEEFHDLDIVRISNQVGNSFEVLGHRVEGVHILSDTSALVSTANHEVYLTIKEEAELAAWPRPAAIYLSVSITDGGPRSASIFSRDAILARILQTLHQDLEPDFVRWIYTDAVLASADFASAAGLTPKPGASVPDDGVAPRRTVPREPLPGVESTNEFLQKRLTDHDPAIFEGQCTPDRLRRIFTENRVDPEVKAARAAADAMARDREDIETSPPLRLAAWAMTFTVALFSLPVGVTLILLNLTKGENLRLASQAAALTGTYISLQTYGVTASAMAALQNWFG